jgi:site-specific DNA-methyltransferase (adenine-specific)
MSGLPAFKHEYENTLFDSSNYKVGMNHQFCYANGAIYNQDCLQFLLEIKDNCIDTVFADPPYNIKKLRGII